MTCTKFILVYGTALAARADLKQRIASFSISQQYLHRPVRNISLVEQFNRLFVLIQQPPPSRRSYRSSDWAGEWRRRDASAKDKKKISSVKMSTTGAPARSTCGRLATGRCTLIVVPYPNLLNECGSSHTFDTCALDHHSLSTFDEIRVDPLY